MKKALIFPLLLAVLFITSCDMFQVDVIEYLDKYTNTAAIEIMDLDNSYPNINGISHLTSDSDKVIRFTLRNPQSYDIDLGINWDDLAVPPVRLEDGVSAPDYSLNQHQSDKSIIVLTFFKDYLEELNEAGGANVSGVISLWEKETKRAFDSYSYELIVNSAPSPVINAQFAESDSSPKNWWVFFNAPEKTGANVDIIGITIDGTYYSYDDARFLKEAPDDLLDLLESPFVPTGENQRYLNTGIASNVDLTRSIGTIDKWGLTSSEVTINTGDIPVVSQPTIISTVADSTGKIILTIETTTPDAKIYFTTDNENPEVSITGSTMLYDKNNKPSVNIAAETRTVKAIATKDSMKPSSVAEQSFSLNRYMVSFDANIGSGTMESQEFVHGIPQAITPSTLTRFGYKFNGWNTQADGNGTPYADGADYIATASATLFAQWSANTSVYLESDTDSVSGTGTESDPFSNFATAKSALPNGGTIIVTKTINPQENAVWRSDIGKSLIVKPSSGNNGSAISVTNENFTLENITINGGSVGSSVALVTTDNDSTNNVTLGEGVVIQGGRAGGVHILDGDLLTVRGNINVSNNTGNDISYQSSTESPIRIAGALDGSINITTHSTEVNAVIASSINSHPITNDDLDALIIKNLPADRITVTDSSDVTIAPLISNASITMNEPTFSNATVDGTWSIEDGSFEGNESNSTIILNTGADLTNQQIKAALQGAINVSNATVEISPSDANVAALGVKEFTVRLTANDNYVFEDRTKTKNIVITFSLKELIDQYRDYYTTGIVVDSDRAGLTPFYFTISAIPTTPTVSFDYNDITQEDRQEAILEGLKASIQFISMPEGLAEIIPLITSAPNYTDATIGFRLTAEDNYVLNTSGVEAMEFFNSLPNVFIPNQADYYVSSNNSPNDTNLGIANTAPFASVQRAVDVINAYNRTTATTIHISGQITEQGGVSGNGGSADSMIVIDGGSNTRNIILQGYDGEASIDAGAKLDGNLDLTEVGINKRILYISGIDTNVTLGTDLTLTGGNTAGSGGAVLIEGGNFFMRGGEVSNNFTESNAAVHLSSGSFTMHEGIISYNRSNNYSGGGVYVTNRYTFTMNGGEISHNKNDTTQGGGVSVRGTFIMTGGEVKDNFEGGGVYIHDNGAMQLSGTPVIKNNKDGSNVRNLALHASANPIKITGSLVEKDGVVPEIYLTSDRDPVTEDYVVAQWNPEAGAPTAMPADTITRFKSDNNSRAFVLDDSKNNIILIGPAP